MLNKSSQEIIDEWKALVKDPNVKREQINVGGQMELALELFDRIELYTDEAEEQTWRQKRLKKIDESTEIPDAIAEQQAEFEAARRGGQMHIDYAHADQPMDWDDRTFDHNVEAHEMPNSREPVDNVMGPSMARSSTDSMMRNLQACEQTAEEHADEMRLAAAEAGAAEHSIGILAPPAVAAANAVGSGTVPAETRLSSVSYLSVGVIANRPSLPDQCFSIGQTFPLAYCGHNRAEGSVSVAVF